MDGVNRAMTGQTWKALLKATAPATMPLFLFSLAVNLLLLTVPIYMMQVFDRVLSGGRLETLLWLSVIAAVALAVYALLDAVRDGLVTQTGQWLHRRLSTRVIKATLGISRGGGTITLQPMLDLRLIRTFAGGQPIKVFFDAPWTVLFLGVLFLIHWLFGLIAFVSLLALITLALVNAYLTKRPNADGATAERRSTSVLEGALGSAEAIGAMGLDAGVQRLWAERQDDADRLTAMGAERSSRCLAFSKFLRLTIQMAVLGLGAVLVLRGQMTAGAMIAASILMSRTLAPFEQSITAWNSFTQARGAFERIGRLLAAAPRLSDHPELPQPEGRLSFDKAVYGVPGRERPLAGPLQLEFEPGTIAAIVGPSGAGKTTLCRLAGGVWNPSYGKVRLDGAELGVWPPEQLGGLVGYLPQDVQLVGDTVHDAISRLEPDAPFEEVVAAAMLAGLHEEIKS
ncbi:MAG: ABC transporter transmembrane domain-containing protein, partial [Pseudomonadota bacterium]